MYNKINNKLIFKTMRNIDVNRFSPQENFYQNKRENKKEQELSEKNEAIAKRAQLMIAEGHELAKEIEEKMKKNAEEHFLGLEDAEHEELLKRTGYSKELIDAIKLAIEKRETTH